MEGHTGTGFPQRYAQKDLWVDLASIIIRHIPCLHLFSFANLFEEPNTAPSFSGF